MYGMLAGQPCEVGGNPELQRALAAHADLFTGPRLRKFFRLGPRLFYSQMLVKFARQPRFKRVPLFFGATMEVALPEGISNSIYRYGFFEADVSSMLLAMLRPGQVFFDVGAHMGYFTCLGAQLVGSGGQVHSFEPTPSTFEVLATNARQWPSVTPNNVAVFSSEGELMLKDFGLLRCAYNSAATPRLREEESGLLQSKSYKVRSVALDAYCELKGIAPDLVKIDAENAEHDILMGMRRTVEQFHPSIIVEVGDMGKDPGSGGSALVIAELRDRGYEAYEWSNQGLIPHQRRNKYSYGNVLLCHPNGSK
jgi:FkbM family methyltransferase